MPGLRNLTGLHFGQWTVIDKAESAKGHTRWNCQCDCGTLRAVMGSHLLDGRTVSCGCIGRHGHAGGRHSLTYNSWRSMLQRCYYKKSYSYPAYGGVGIKVCDEWRNSFQQFLNDMGVRPSRKHSLDRFPDKSGDYRPGNCRWATSIEQSNNRTSNLYYEMDKKEMTLAEWARVYNMRYGTLAARIKAGLTLRDALQKPVRSYKWKGIHGAEAISK